MVADGPWAKFKRVVDVGGGHGHFMHRILEAHPEICGAAAKQKAAKRAPTRWKLRLLTVNIVGRTSVQDMYRPLGGAKQRREKTNDQERQVALAELGQSLPAQQSVEERL